MIHAVNKLVPELVPNSVDIISTWVEDVGLDASIMTDEDARSAAEVSFRLSALWVSSKPFLQHISAESRYQLYC